MKTLLQIIVAIVLLLSGALLLAHLEGCFSFDEEHRLYILSPSSGEMHVLNARNFTPVLSQPLKFTSVGTPRAIDLNLKLHQILAVIDNSKTLVRIGTEKPFQLVSLPFTSYGGSTDVIVAALGNPFYETNVVLTTSQLINIDAYGNSVTAASPSASPTPEETPTPTTRTLPKTSRLNALSLPTDCGPTGLALNAITVFRQRSEFKVSSSPSASPTSSPTASPAPTGTPTASIRRTAVGGFSFEGGDKALVICGGSNKALLYNTESLTLQTTLALADGSHPLKTGFLRDTEEEGETVTGHFVIWNGDGTIDLVDSSSGSRVSSSAISVSGGSAFSDTYLNMDDGLIISGYGDASGSFVDVRNINGTAVEGSPFVLPDECGVSGPRGVYGETLDLDPVDGFPDAPTTDTVAWYSCSSGLIGAYSGNLGLTFLQRSLGSQVGPSKMVLNPEIKVIYVLLTGSTAPAPGIMAINKESLTDAFFPTAVSFTHGAPDSVILIP